MPRWLSPLTQGCVLAYCPNSPPAHNIIDAALTLSAVTLLLLFFYNPPP